MMWCALLCFMSINVNILKFLFLLFLARKRISSQGKKNGTSALKIAFDFCFNEKDKEDTTDAGILYYC